MPTVPQASVCAARGGVCARPADPQISPPSSPWQFMLISMDAASWATVVTAAFAAVAAVASWASVAQTRRERIASETPDLHMEVIETLGQGTRGIRIQIVNSGGLAKRVRFAVVQGNQLAYGHPPPTPTFRPGESRIIESALTPSAEKEVVAYVACFDARGKWFYFWPRIGDRRAYRVADLGSAFNDDALMRELIPDFNIAAMTMVTYETVERTT